MSNNKPRSSKPYDPNNSFVKKVASRVSGLIPKSTSWLSGWFSPTTASEQQTNDRVEQINNDEEHFEDALEKPPPAKRLKVTSNQQYSETYNRCHNVEQGEGSSRLAQNNFIDTSAIPGPSGLGTRPAGFVASTPAATSVEHLEPKANGEECSESGESTSGCSSLEPQINRGLPCAQNQSRQNDSLSPRKQHLIDDKLNYSYLQNSRSLFLDRTSSSRNNQTVGRRNNPSFCVNTFGTPLFGERGSVNDLIMNSPFYSGRTTYGGASSASYRRSLGSASLSSSPANSEKLARHTIKVKPGSSQSTADTSMSQTAKRILATLEQFSTPILDAKRIPVSQEPVLASLGSRKRTRADETAQLVLEQPRVPKRTSNKPLHWAKGAPSTSQLTIPTVPDTLIHRRREIVQEQISTATQSPSTKADSYELRSENNESSSTRNMLKMKQKPRLTEKAVKEPEMASEVNLPQVPLQISTLPTFDICVPAPKPDTSKTSAPSVSSFGSSTLNKPQPVPQAPMAATSSPVPSFKLSTEPASSDAAFSFSTPIRVSTASKEQTTLTPVNNFTFSNPLPASAKFMESSNNSVKPRPKTTEGSPRQIDSFHGGLKPASQLKAGSVMDILGKGKSDATPSANGSLSLMDKFKPAAGTWECEKCLIRNKSDLLKCAACENPREAKTPSSVSVSTEKKVTQAITPLKSSSEFGAQFKMAGGMWECSACMVRNKDSESKCVACTTPKPGAAPAKPAAAATSFSGWGDKFKPPSNTWECSVCMVRNGSELSACQSCSTKKPGSTETSNPPVKSSWGDQFKKPEGSWSCTDCMVTNKSTDLSCVACSAKKPGSDAAPASAKPSTQFSFGIPPSNNGGAAAPAFSFGIPKDKTEGNEGEKSSVSSSTGFKLGDSKPAPTTFSFGVPPSAASATPASSAASTAASSAASTAAPLFGSAPTAPTTTNSTLTEKKQETAAPEVSKPTFSFGVPTASVAKPATPMFSFSAPSTATSETTKPTSSTGSPLGGKRKFGDDAPSSSAPFKFGSSPVSQAKPVITSTSSVSSTSGPVFSFSSSSNATLSSASPLLTTTVTSTANGQNAIGAKSATTNSLFAVAAPATSSPASKPALAFGASASATKDESVSSTWKPPSPRNVTSVDGAKPAADTNGAPAGVKPFTFGSTVSSSNMAFGSNANSATSTFAFGSTSDKAAATSKPALSFGSTSSPAPLFSAPASTAPLFGAGAATPASATPTFGSTNHVGFGSLSSSTNPAPTFQTTNSAAPNFNAPAASAFSSPFGGTSEEKKDAFSFSAPPAKKAPGFPFSAPDDSKKVFSFNTSAADDSKKSAPGFSFSATPATTTQNSFAAAPPVFQFGAAASAPASNGPAKPDFAFGGNQPTSFSGFNSQPASSSAGFSFGAQTPSFGSVDSSAASATTPFGGAGPFNSSITPSFGATNPGFNFAAGNPSGVGAPAQPGAFNFSGDARPSFFSATPDPSASAGPQRRIKRATRRVPK